MLQGGSGSNIVQVGKREGDAVGRCSPNASGSLRRQIALFGTGAWGPQFAGTGPYRELVDRPVADLERRRPARQAGRRRQDGQQAPAVACRRTRRSSRRRSRGTSPTFASAQSIALGLNGRIAAVSHTYGTAGKLRFSLLASDKAFRAGKNDARIFLVTGPKASPELHELQVAYSS